MEILPIIPCSIISKDVRLPHNSLIKMFAKHYCAVHSKQIHPSVRHTEILF